MLRRKLPPQSVLASASHEVLARLCAIVLAKQQSDDHGSQVEAEFLGTLGWEAFWRSSGTSRPPPSLFEAEMEALLALAEQEVECQSDMTP
eukprot:GAFH01004383.1.p5 GENE.GAFH01004383.1~~GAFH01004383.1.p5  ORF type:complete len:91 (-),score=9.87 GAFH01004383.1:399-671(-)